MCRLILLSILVVAGLLNVPVWKEAAAAPVTTAAQQEVATFGNGLRLPRSQLPISLRRPLLQPSLL